MTEPVAPRANLHSHMWVFGLLGVAAGAALLIVAPRLALVSGSLFLFAAFHLVGAVVLLSSLYVVALRRIMRALRPRTAEDTATRYDFGWGPGWMNGLWIAALVVLSGAVVLQISLPNLWPIAFALVLFAAGLFAGNLVMAGFRRLDQVVLPWVDLLSGDSDLVLDAGCGSGRTAIALAPVLKNGRVVAVDRFDAGYIDDGGRALLDRNLRIAGLADRVRVETGDLTHLPFVDATFDSAVSTHVFDHLGADKQTALGETRRVLKPGGRFLMAVWVPGWTMFAVGNFLSFFLTSKSGWRRMARTAGFTVRREGVFNGTWYALLEAPGALT